MATIDHSSSSESEDELTPREREALHLIAEAEADGRLTQVDATSLRDERAGYVMSVINDISTLKETLAQALADSTITDEEYERISQLPILERVEIISKIDHCRSIISDAIERVGRSVTSQEHFDLGNIENIDERHATLLEFRRIIDRDRLTEAREKGLFTESLFAELVRNAHTAGGREELSRAVLSIEKRQQAVDDATKMVRRGIIRGVLNEAEGAEVLSIDDVWGRCDQAKKVRSLMCDAEILEEAGATDTVEAILAIDNIEERFREMKGHAEACKMLDAEVVRLRAESNDYQLGTLLEKLGEPTTIRERYSIYEQIKREYSHLFPVEIKVQRERIDDPHKIEGSLLCTS